MKRFFLVILAVVSASCIFCMAAQRHNSAKLVLGIQCSSEPTSLSFSPDGLRLVMNDTETGLSVRDVRTGKKLSSLKDSGVVLETKFFARNKYIAGSCDPATIRIWETKTGRLVGTLLGHRNKVPETGYVYDAATGKASYPPTGRKVSASISSFDISPDEKVMLTVSDDKTIEVWNVTNYKLQKIFKAHKNLITSALFSPNGKSVASLDDAGAMKLWEPLSGKIIHGATVTSGSTLEWGRAGTEIILTTADGNKLIYSAKTFQLIRKKKAANNDIGPVNPTQMVDYSANGARITICEPLADLTHKSGGVAYVYDACGKLLEVFDTAQPFSQENSPNLENPLVTSNCCVPNHYLYPEPITPPQYFPKTRNYPTLHPSMPGTATNLGRNAVYV